MRVDALMRRMFRLSPYTMLCVYSCLGLLFFVVSFGSYLAEVVDLVPDTASLHQCAYIALTLYLESTLNYLVLDSLVFSILMLSFIIVRWLVFRGTSDKEDMHMVELVMGISVFRIVFLGSVLDADLKEFSAWSLITEVTLLLKVIVKLAISRQRSLSDSDLLIEDEDDDHEEAVIDLAGQRSNNNLRRRFHSFTRSIRRIIRNGRLLREYLMMALVFAIWTMTLVLIGQVLSAVTRQEKYSVRESTVYLLIFDTITVLFDCVHFTVLFFMNHGFCISRKSVLFNKHCSDLVCSAVSHSLPLSEYALVWWVRGVNFSMADFILVVKSRSSLSSMISAWSQYCQFSRVVSKIDRSFAQPSEEEMQGEICSICRDELTRGVAKKLPCGHLFHFNCLVKWMKYKRMCPICRRDVYTGEAQVMPPDAPNPRPNVNNNNGNGDQRRPPLNNIEEMNAGLELFEAAARRGGVPIGATRALANLLHRFVPRPAPITDAQIDQVNEVLNGRVPRDEIRAQLRAQRGSVHRTIEYFFTHA